MYFLSYCFLIMFLLIYTQILLICVSISLNTHLLPLLATQLGSFTKYISYISTVEKNVFSSKENDRNHTRKYLGIVYSINGYNYYIPLSSPKNSDYRMENGVQKIRGSIVPIIRITSQSSSGELELKGTLKLSNMIPVPASELTLYDMEHEPDLFYKALIHKEMLFIRKNKNKIIQNAKILYKQKKENNPAIGYLKSTVDLSLLEQMHDKFIEKKSN